MHDHRADARRYEAAAVAQLAVLPQGRPVANDQMVAASTNAAAVAQIGILHALLDLADAVRSLAPAQP
ncbi:hypothetical protein [Streptomyces albipurpureus]|uniref:Uncharacterized protein n=1 Tax=Streptomyces albipurpureus TaxID=2897419 RepID=A0ABT0UP15_9ACTN|nr:hypothetical protein [Streptomyces sp. CWNU-1]MCM2390180.1 hypothetical protein [Streptomyces sp. CWNU-1]